MTRSRAHRARRAPETPAPLVYTHLVKPNGHRFHVFISYDSITTLHPSLVRLPGRAEGALRAHSSTRRLPCCGH